MSKKNVSASDKSQSSTPSLRLSKETVRNLRVTTGFQTGFGRPHQPVMASVNDVICTNAW